MSTQEIFACPPQASMGFAEPPQGDISFPLTLSEKYQPRLLSDLIGLEFPRRVLGSLIKAPRACALLFLGHPGLGKTIAGMCFASELGGDLVHVSSQKCDVATLDSLRDRFAYYPPSGKFWIALVDEADQMSEKAQIQLLSRLDATASLKPTFGGASVRGSQPMVIWIFTANGRGEHGIEPPPSLEKRFLSRCMIVPFGAPSSDEISSFLRHVWEQESGPDASAEYFYFIAEGGCIRDSLMRLQVDLLGGGPRSIVRPKPTLVMPSPATRKSPTDEMRRQAALKAWATRRQIAKAR